MHRETEVLKDPKDLWVSRGLRVSEAQLVNVDPLVHRAQPGRLARTECLGLPAVSVREDRPDLTAYRESKGRKVYRVQWVSKVPRAQPVQMVQGAPKGRRVSEALKGNEVRRVNPVLQVLQTP